MPENDKRYPLVFDKEIVRLSMDAAKKRGEPLSMIGHGASVIINGEFTRVRAEEDNMLVLYGAGVLSDPYYPVIDEEKKIIVGVYFTASPLLFIYPGRKIPRGTKVEFGRYLCFVPNWRVVHIALIEEENKPGSALLVQN